MRRRPWFVGEHFDRRIARATWSSTNFIPSSFLSPEENVKREFSGRPETFTGRICTPTIDPFTTTALRHGFDKYNVCSRRTVYVNNYHKLRQTRDRPVKFNLSYAGNARFAFISTAFSRPEQTRVNARQGQTAFNVFFFICSRFFRENIVTRTLRR